MKLLLDTHVLLWWLSGSRRLGHSSRTLIADPENAIFVSAVSLWEIWLKQSIGKLDIPSDFEEQLESEGFEFLPLAREHTREVANLPCIHRDPFDRMLIAQARVCGMRLLSSDRISSDYGEVVLKA